MLACQARRQGQRKAAGAGASWPAIAGLVDGPAACSCYGKPQSGGGPSAPDAEPPPRGPVRAGGLEHRATFVEVFRLWRPWISRREGKRWRRGPRLDLDEYGRVRRLEPGCWAETLMCTIDGGYHPAGRYVCLYDGKGRIELRNAKRAIERKPGRIVFEPDLAKAAFSLRVGAANPRYCVGNIRIRPCNEANLRQARPAQDRLLP